jgi:protein-S-isoprenylcysteine O-methyltransferase Ste14
MNDLDKLLSQPLPSVVDDRFSARVMRRVRVEQLRGHWKTAAAVAVCVVLIFLALPLHAIGAVLGAGLPQIAGSWTISLAAGIVAVSLLAARELTRQ